MGSFRGRLFLPLRLASQHPAAPPLLVASPAASTELFLCSQCVVVIKGACLCRRRSLLTDDESGSVFLHGENGGVQFLVSVVARCLCLRMWSGSLSLIMWSGSVCSRVWSGSLCLRMWSGSHSLRMWSGSVCSRVWSGSLCLRMRSGAVRVWPGSLRGRGDSDCARFTLGEALVRAEEEEEEEGEDCLERLAEGCSSVE